MGAPVLASSEFNAHPVALRIVGTRAAHAGLFALLATSHDPIEASEMFTHYLSWYSVCNPSSKLAITEQTSALLALALQP